MINIVYQGYDTNKWIMNAPTTNAKVNVEAMEYN